MTEYVEMTAEDHNYANILFLLGLHETMYIYIVNRSIPLRQGRKLLDSEIVDIKSWSAYLNKP